MSPRKEWHTVAALTARCDELLAHLVEAANWIEQAIKDIGGCDHSVGICCCGDIRLLESIREAIAVAQLERAVSQCDTVAELTFADIKPDEIFCFANQASPDFWRKHRDGTATILYGKNAGFRTALPPAKPVIRPDGGCGEDENQGGGII